MLNIFAKMVNIQFNSVTFCVTTNHFILSYHAQPAALHVWSVDRAFQINNSTLVWA